MSNIEKYEQLLKECRLDPYKFFKSRKDFMRDVRIHLHPDVSPNREACEKLIKEFSSLESDNLDCSKISDYRIVRKIRKGDLSEVFVVEKSNEYFVAKKPVVKSKVYSKKEFEVLTDIRKKFDPKDLYFNAIPQPVEMVDDTTIFKTSGRADCLDDYISGDEVIQKYGNKLDSRHIVWMAKRVLALLARIHDMGFVNGAITPKHLLFRKPDHGMLCLGWLHSGKIGDTISIIPKEYAHYYPKETKDSKKLTKDLDIYMLSKSMLDIAGSECHVRIRNFFQSCVNFNMSMRPDSAGVLYGELVEVSRSVFGTPKFVSLD